MVANSNFETSMALAIAEIVRFDMSKPLGKAQAEAAADGIKRARFYKDKGFMESFITAALDKRMEYIKNAKTVEEIHQIMKAPHPTYNGNGIETVLYPIDEEECLCWSLASLEAPLNEYAFQRYMSLFEKITGTKIA